MVEILPQLILSLCARSVFVVVLANGFSNRAKMSPLQVDIAVRNNLTYCWDYGCTNE